MPIKLDKPCINCGHILLYHEDGFCYDGEDRHSPLWEGTVFVQCKCIGYETGNAFYGWD